MASGSRDIDQGYKELVRRVFDLKSPKVAVGIFEADGAQEHDGERGTTVLDVAVWNEFGTDTIPERSFLRGWFDENIDRAREAMRRLMVQVVEGKITKSRALDLFGLWVQAEIQKRIAQGIPPPNAPSTIENKGSSKPLIDTGQLRSSITYGVDAGDGQMKVKPSHAQIAYERAVKIAKRLADKKRRDEKKEARRAVKKAVKKTIKKGIKGVKKSARIGIKSISRLARPKKKRR